jgi:hypothetical protein
VQAEVDGMSFGGEIIEALEEFNRLLKGGTMPTASHAKRSKRRKKTYKDKSKSHAIRKAKGSMADRRLKKV